MKTNISFIEFITKFNALMEKYKIKEIRSEKGTSSSIKRVDEKLEIVGF